jgi:protein-S-isoprenylcysteine O-methyltransferase Ste14
MPAWQWRNVPLPEPHLGGLVIGTLLQVVVPWPLAHGHWGAPVTGGLLMLAGLSLATWAVTTAATVNLAQPHRIIRSGPYGRSRNPMYVAWTLVYLGVALIANTAWPLVLLPAVLLWTHAVVLREERHLESHFGAEYRQYRSSVRRYI